MTVGHICNISQHYSLLQFKTRVGVTIFFFKYFVPPCCFIGVVATSLPSVLPVHTLSELKDFSIITLCGIAFCSFCCCCFD